MAQAVPVSLGTERVERRNPASLRHSQVFGPNVAVDSAMVLHPLPPVEAQRIRVSEPNSGTEGDASKDRRPLSRPPPQPTKSLGTVVIIDDSATALVATSQWLEAEGYRVVPLARALGATSTLLHVHPDLLLLDIVMPGLSGDRFARILSQSPATASIPIIFHSEIDANQLKSLAHECAVVGAIPKSSSRTSFMHAFEKLALPFINTSTSLSDSSPRKLTDPADIGIAELDLQRRHVKRLTHRLAEIMHDIKNHDQRSPSRHTLRIAVLELLVFMRFHLATEDRYLRSADRRLLGVHRTKHDAYLDESTTIERAVELDLPLSDMIDYARRIRLLALAHLWATDPEDFKTDH